MERLWTRPFIQSTASMLLLFTGFYFLLPTLPLYMKQMGGSEAQVGLAAGLFTLTAVVFRPIVGGLLDRYGRKPFAVWGLLLFILAMVAYQWATVIVLLLALRVLHGVGWAFATTGVGTAVTDIIPPKRRGEGMGWYGMAMTTAMAIGPLLGIWLMDNHSFPMLFVAGAALSALALLLVWMTAMPFTPRPGGGRLALVERSVLPVMAVIFFLALSYGGITTFLPLFAQSLEVNAGTFFLVYALTLTAIRPVAGKLSDQYGEAAVILPALAVTAASLLVLAFSSGLSGVVVSAVLFGIGFGSAQPALQAATLRIAHPERKGAANASFMTAFDGGIGIGSIVLGLISNYLNYTVLFVVSSASVVIALVLFAATVSRRVRGSEAA